MAETIKSFVTGRLEAGDSAERAWRAAQDRFAGTRRIVSWNHVSKLARDWKRQKQATCKTKAK